MDRLQKNNLVILTDIDSDFIIELKYATANNFFKMQVYKDNTCIINADTAQRLIKAKNIFAKDGYRVKVWDVYRPLSVQKKFYDILPDDKYVATPPDMNNIKKIRASHWNGMCVDITLTNKEGVEIEMPTPFDDFSEMAGLQCMDIPYVPRKNAEYMRDVMISVGFDNYDVEWWHFYDRKSALMPFSDIIL